MDVLASDPPFPCCGLTAHNVISFLGLGRPSALFPKRSADCLRARTSASHPQIVSFYTAIHPSLPLYFLHSINILRDLNLSSGK